MSYTALYRKFRPDNFADVKGQDHIVTTLTNQIKHNRIGHAVDQRGEGIVQKADAGILAHKGSFQGQSVLRVKVRETGLWSEWAKPVSMTRASSTVTLPETRKPSTVSTYCPW